MQAVIQFLSPSSKSEIDKQSLEKEIGQLLSGPGDKNSKTQEAKKIYNTLMSGKQTETTRLGMDLLAALFRKGEIIDQDFQKAFDLCKAAADSGAGLSH